MELQELLDLISDPKELVAAIKGTKDKDFSNNYAEWVKQWNTKTHNVITDTINRPDKQMPDGRTIRLVRLPIPFQKLIVRRSASFLCGIPIEIDAKVEDGSTEEQLLQLVHKAWDDNKLDYGTKRLAKLMMSETEAAELWYLVELPPNSTYWEGTPNAGKSNVKLRLRSKILANKFGDSLYPVFDQTGDMIAFGRGYIVITAGVKVEHMDIYTEEKRYLLEKSGEDFKVIKTEAEPTGKIPVIYYAQEEVEWVDVQTLIDRIEVALSKLSDTNDYFGHPILALEAEQEDDVTWPDKDTSGKAVLLKNNAKANYLTWPLAPESVKMELLELRSQIMTLTDTLDFSFDQVKGLGNYSGVALRMLFIGAHMKASEHEEVFGEGIQRRLNFLVAANKIINNAWEKVILTLKPRFTYFVPKNEVEETTMLLAAMGSDKPLISQDTAIERSGIIEDKKGEKERLKAERDEAAAQARVISGSQEALDNELNVA